MFMNLNNFFDEDDQVKPGVMILDTSTLMIATISHTFKPEDVVTEGMLRHLILDTIRFNVLKFKNEYPEVILAMDNSKMGYWRRDIAHYYKMNRKKKRDEDVRDWEMIFGLIHKVTEELKENMPYKVLDLQKTEADDIIAVLSKKFTAEGRKVLLVASDGDYTQLHGLPGLRQWSPIEKSWKKCKHGSPYKDLMYKLIKGDAKDGVAGIKSRSDYIISKLDGERAPAITKKFLEEIYNAADPVELLTEQEKARYNENQMLIDFNFIPDYISNPILKAYDEVQAAPRMKMYPYFVRSQLMKMIEKISDF